MQNILSTLKIEILEAQRSVLNSQWACQRDNSPHSRLYFVNKGLGFVEHHGQHHLLTPGNFYLIPPFSNLSYGCKDTVEISWVHFNAKLLTSIDLFDFVSCEYELNNYSYFFEEIVQKIICSFHSKTIRKQLFITAKLLELLTNFVKMNQPEKIIDKQRNMLRFQPVIRYIEENLTNSITVSDLAEKAFLERAYFSTKFREQFGISPAQYINRKRIEKSRILLAKTDHKLEYIGSSLGFNDAFHFSKTFKKITGVSPNVFRKQSTLILP